MKESSQKTYAEITKVHKENLKSVVKEQKEEDNKEERDIESRKANIIIHGIMEPMKDTKEKDQEEDKGEIEEILSDIDIHDIKLTHHCIGTKHEKGHKWRPIKVILQNVNDKRKNHEPIIQVKEIW